VAVETKIILLMQKKKKAILANIAAVFTIFVGPKKVFGCRRNNMLSSFFLIKIITFLAQKANIFFEKPFLVSHTDNAIRKLRSVKNEILSRRLVFFLYYSTQVSVFLVILVLFYFDVKVLQNNNRSAILNLLVFLYFQIKSFHQNLTFCVSLELHIPQFKNH
jgi:hypothetical protein